MSTMHVTVTEGKPGTADSVHAGKPERNGTFLGLVWDSLDFWSFSTPEGIEGSTADREDAVRNLVAEALDLDDKVLTDPITIYIA